jgi:hypothetical protein
VSADKKSPPRYRLTFALDVPADLIALRDVDPAALVATQAIIEDLAHGRVRGKLLGERRVSGNLTGLARVKFDIAGRLPQRFRLLYQQVNENTRHVVAIGVRDEHAIYRTAVHRVTQA